MYTESHSSLADLERRHRDLEKQIEDAVAHPGTDTLTLTELRRRKLQLKDEIRQIEAELLPDIIA